MRIEEFRIDRYGPLSGFHFEHRQGLSLFYGPNEWGKTLIIDAILNLLFKKGIKRHHKHFGNLSRVLELPEGYMVIEAAGEQHKLGRSESVSPFYPVEITPLDFRNVFMIRDSDLSVAEETRYFTEVTEKLTGMRTAEIQRLMTAVQKNGQLTRARADAQLSDSEEFGKIASKVEEADELITEVAGLRRRLAEARFDELEKELAGARHRLAETNRLLEEQKQVKTREAMEIAAGHLDELRSIDQLLGGLKEITDSQFEAWQKAQWNLTKVKEARNGNDRSLADVRSKLEVGRKKWIELQARVKLAEEKKQAIDIKLEPQIQDCRRIQKKISHASAREGADKLARNICLVVLLAALAGSVFTPSIIFWAAGALGLAGTVYFGRRILVLYHQRGHAAESFESLFLDASEYGLEAGGSLEDLLRAIDEVEQNLKLLEQQAGRAEQEINALERETGRLEDRLMEQNKTIDQMEEEIRSLQAASRMDRLDDFKAALQDRRENEKKKVAIEAVLASLLGTGGAGPPAADVWAKTIEQTRRDLQAPDGVKYDAGRVEAFEAEAASLRRTAEELSERQQAAHQEIRRIQSRLSTMDLPVRSPDELRSAAALEALEDTLSAFVSDTRDRADRARTALRLLSRIADEEKGRVSRLFGTGMRVSKYFAEFTNNRYHEVSYEPDDSKIFVHRPDGSRLAAGSLSGGAFDQLYLAIRLSIGERYLQGETGFFILDDPFIKSDADRLSRQLDSLVRLAENGWQILYFSAKNEVKDFLAGLNKPETVEIIDLENRFTLEPR